MHFLSFRGFTYPSKYGKIRAYNNHNFIMTQEILIAYAAAITVLLFAFAWAELTEPRI